MRFATNVLFLAIAAVLVGSLLIPIVNDAAAPDSVEYNNSGSINAAVLKDGDTGSIAMDDTAVKITINGTVQTYSPTSQVNVIYGENVLLNHNNGAAVFSITTRSGGTSTVTSNLSALSYVVDGQTLKLTVGESTIEVDLGLTLVWGDSGTYTAAFKQNGSTIYYSEKSPYLLNVGTYGAKNGVVFPDTYSLTDNHALVEGTQDVYSVKYSAADYLLKDGDDASANAGVWMMVSKEVVGLGEEKVGSTEKALIFVIPVLVTIGLVIAAVSIIRNRD